jgi:hypothetical protein
MPRPGQLMNALDAPGRRRDRRSPDPWSESAQAWIDRAWVRFGYDRDHPAEWAKKRIYLSKLASVDARDFAPKAWAAAVQLLGGENRVELPWQWNDGFIANLGVGDDRPWEPPSAELSGWHKDGDFFRHFLDSPEQGLLTIVLWIDMHHQGGGTYIAADSVPVMARYLAGHLRESCPPSSISGH